MFSNSFLKQKIQNKTFDESGRSIEVVHGEKEGVDQHVDPLPKDQHADQQLVNKPKIRDKFLELLKDGQTLYQCKECKITRQNVKVLKNHIKQVHPTKLFHCKFCKYQAKKRYYLRRHVQIHKKQQENNQLKYLKCTYCLYEISTETYQGI